MPVKLPEGRFRFLEWEEMDGGSWHRLYVEDREMGYVCLVCEVADLDGELSCTVRDNVDGYEAASEFFTAAHTVDNAKAWCEAKAASLLEEGVGWTPHAAEITAAAVKAGLSAGVVRFAAAPGDDGATVCRIGDNWFYFDTPDADAMGPDEYLAAKGAEHAVARVVEVLAGFEADDPDEHAYYEAVLREAGCLAAEGE